MLTAIRHATLLDLQYHILTWELDAHKGVYTYSVGVHFVYLPSTVNVSYISGFVLYPAVVSIPSESSIALALAPHAERMYQKGT